jgi:hypothetical protein
MSPTTEYDNFKTVFDFCRSVHIVVSLYQVEKYRYVSPLMTVFNADCCKMKSN